MGLDLYKLPLGLTEGVKIPLPHTKVSFTVVLPGNNNEEFASRLMAMMNMEVTGDEEELKFDAGLFHDKRKVLFFDTCIVTASGIPKGMSIDEFFKEYPIAAKYVYQKANELTLKADAEVDEALEKLWPTQNGKSSGQESTANMKSLNVTTSPLEQGVPN